MEKVYFIGAGPGDPDLITVKGKKIVEKASQQFEQQQQHYQQQQQAQQKAQEKPKEKKVVGEYVDFEEIE